MALPRTRARRSRRAGARSLRTSPARSWGPVETPGDGGSGAAQSAAFLSEHEAEEDAKYNSMTDEQREAYYVRPSFLTRVKQFFKGV